MGTSQISIDAPEAYIDVRIDGRANLQPITYSSFRDSPQTCIRDFRNLKPHATLWFRIRFPGNLAQLAGNADAIMTGNSAMISGDTWAARASHFHARHHWLRSRRIPARTARGYCATRQGDRFSHVESAEIAHSFVRSV